MDYEEVQGAYQRAINSNDQFSKYYKEYPNKEKHHGFEEHKPTEYANGYGFPTKYIDEEVDYSIVKMSKDEYIVARSRRLGSLDYDFVCTCRTLHEAHEIVKALNK